MSDASVEKFIEELVLNAGAILMQHRTPSLQRFVKGSHGDFATSADFAAQKYIVDTIQKTMPNDGIIAEENFCRINTRSGFTWIIDPLDGTRNYASGNDLFGVMIARADKNILLNAAIYFPTDNTLFSAMLGNGALCNGQKIHISFPQSLRDVRACIAHTDPLASTTQALDAARSLLPSTGFAPCTLFSSAANTRSLLEGKHDAFIIPSNCVWDSCAPSLLLSEAGFVVSDWLRHPIHPRFGTQHFIAAPKTVYEQLQQTLAAFLV